MPKGKYTSQALARYFLRLSAPLNVPAEAEMPMGDEWVQYNTTLPYGSDEEQDRETVTSLLSLIEAQGLRLTAFHTKDNFGRGTRLGEMTEGRFSFAITTTRDFVESDGTGRRISIEKQNRRLKKKGMPLMGIPLQLFFHKNDLERIKSALKDIAQPGHPDHSFS